MAKVDKLVVQIDNDVLKMLLTKLSQLDARVTSLASEVMVLQSQVNSK